MSKFTANVSVKSSFSYVEPVHVSYYLFCDIILVLYLCYVFLGILKNFKPLLRVHNFFLKEIWSVILASSENGRN